MIKKLIAQLTVGVAANLFLITAIPTPASAQGSGCRALYGEMMQTLQERGPQSGRYNRLWNEYQQRCEGREERRGEDWREGREGRDRGPGRGQCEELRKACLNKDQLGEQGEGNCRRYRQTCRQ